MRTRVTFLAVLLGLAVAMTAYAPAQPPQPLPAAQPVMRPSPDLAAVPTDTFAFFTVKVSKLWDNPNFKPLRDWFTAQNPGPTDQMCGLPPADIDRVTFFMPGVPMREPGAVLLVNTRKPYNEAKVLKSLEAVNQEKRPGPGTGKVFRTDNGPFEVVVLIDARTLMFLPELDDGTGLAGLVGKLIARKPDGILAEALADADKHDIAMAIDARPISALVNIENNREAAPYLALFKARTVTFAADFDKTARGYLKLNFANADDAKRAAPVLKEGITEIAGQMGKELDRRKDKMDPAERIFLESAITVLKAAKVDANGTNVFATADLPYQDTVTKFVAALPKSYSAAVSSVKGQNNLKQLGLAMHNFHDAMGFLPSDVYPAGGKNLEWSWRVQILPYIEQDNLYKQLDMTKPWDAPENLKRLEAMEMPKTFEIPGRPAPKGQTYFRIFTKPENAKGKDRPFLIEGQKGPTLVGITDGSSNTFMIVEAGEAVPWYKPDVLAFDGQLPLPQLGDKSADKFIVCFADGSVRVLRPSKLGEKTLRALITPQGGEVVDLP